MKKHIPHAGLSKYEISESGELSMFGQPKKARRTFEDQRVLVMPDGSIISIAELVLITYEEDCPPLGLFEVLRRDGNIKNDHINNLAALQPDGQVIEFKRRTGADLGSVSNAIRDKISAKASAY